MSERYGVCFCGTASPVDADAVSAVCAYCGDEMIIVCPHCEAPLETHGKFCRRCGEEVLEGVFRRSTTFVPSSWNGPHTPTK